MGEDVLDVVVERESGKELRERVEQLKRARRQLTQLVIAFEKVGRRDAVEVLNELEKILDEDIEREESRTGEEYDLSDLSGLERMVQRARKVVITDLKNYCKRKCYDGGRYSFSICYERAGRNKWEVLHETSCSFPYCYVFGVFRICWDCPHYERGGDGCKAKLEVVTTKEVVEEIRKSLDDEFVEVKIDYKVIKRGKIGCEQCRKGLH